MLSLQQFSQLSYEEKKETLIEILQQLHDQKTDFSDIIFLLNASDKIQEKTMDAMYVNLIGILDKAKEMDLLRQKSSAIKKMMEDDILQQKESDEADQILKGI